jgi:hypothetical protein
MAAEEGEEGELDAETSRCREAAAAPKDDTGARWAGFRVYGKSKDHRDDLLRCWLRTAGGGPQL